MRRGFTLIEIIVVIALVAVLVGILASSLDSVPLVRDSALRTRAYALLEEEMVRLKEVPSNELTNRANARFAGLLYNRGAWYVSKSAPQSAPHVLTLGASASLIANDVSGSLKVPVDTASDFILQTSIRIEDNLPSNWRAGIFFRARDLENQYRIVILRNRLRVEKFVNGAITELSSNPVTIDAGRWYILRVRASGATIETRLNGALISQVTDSEFGSGYLGFISLFGALFDLDDISLSLERSFSWNFDNDEAGLLPNSWRDFGVYELPRGVDFLTIANYLGRSDIKHVTAQIDWQENNATSSARLETLISN